MTKAPQIFDRRLVRRHKARATAGYEDHDFLFREIGERLLERLAEINRRFATVLALGAPLPGLDTMLPGARIIHAWDRPATGRDIVLDEEALPFAPQSLDLVIALGGLHWVNDLPGCLLQIRHMLKPDGLFMAAMAGGATLAELRQACLEADMATLEGAAPRVAPFADVRDLGGLLQRAGFAMPVADADRLTVHYHDIGKLLADLRGMGESAAMTARHRRPMRRDTLAAMTAMYRSRFATPDGLLPARFEIVYLAGWAPGPGQPQPKKPGSATARLADALGAVEQSTGAKATPR